jgi:hypothetical protein
MNYKKKIKKNKKFLFLYVVEDNTPPLSLT